jgi:hypothetical protein
MTMTAIRRATTMHKSYTREPGMIRGGLYGDRHMATYEVAWGSRFALGLKVSTTGEETLDVRLGLGPVQLYGSTTLRREDGRDRRLPPLRVDLDAYWLHHDLWLRLDLGEYDPAYGRGRVHVLKHTGPLKDRLLGRTVYASREVKRATSVAPLPEGGVPCEIVWEEATWKRPRWRTLRVLRATVTPTGGSVDRIFDVCAPVKFDTETEAVLLLTSHVLRDRERHGGQLSTPRP